MIYESGLRAAIGEVFMSIFESYIPTLKIYILYSSVCGLCVLFGIFILPETKGKHLEDINKEFEEKKFLNEKHTYIQNLISIELIPLE